MYSLADDNPEKVFGQTSESKLRIIKGLLEQPESLQRLTEICFRLVEDYGNDRGVSPEVYSGTLVELIEEADPTVVISNLEAWVTTREIHMQIEQADRREFPLSTITNLHTLYYPHQT